MRRFLAILAAAALLAGCASKRSELNPQGDTAEMGVLREAFRGARWGPWTPEFPPQGR